MKKITLEICCGSVEDVYAAARAGADRVELNSALFLGGLSPSIGELRLAKKAGIPIMAMVRPREGGFCYSDGEFQTMLADIDAFISEGVEGLVFGVLTPDGRVDRDRNALLVQACGDRETVFHRAIDVTPDWREALDTLVQLGFDRVLTSGQAENAIWGTETIRQMVEYASGKIEILPGGGVRPNNAAELLEKTGCLQLHTSCSSLKNDDSCKGNPVISFRGKGLENEISICDEDRIKALVSAIKRS